MSNSTSPIINPNQLLRIKDLVTLLSVSESTVRRYVQSGILPKPRKLSPRVVVWKYSDIKDSVDSIFV
ncbi:helix-turn-helix transcriptional regulator [Poseidonibacter sp.]|uniref:helix-turn-helix transcriptional regulator n=1 Tax=Poseidonibacter sp. TaxID=2321188 RepID=UPI003C74BC10